MRRLLICLVVLPVALASLAQPTSADPPTDRLEIAFADCEEHIGIELVDAELVADLVPAEFGLGFLGMAATGAASLIVRTAECDTSVDGRDLGRVTTSQVGVITAVTDADDLDDVPSNGVDNYTLFFVTDSKAFDRALSATGVKIDHDPRLELDIVSTGEMSTMTASLHRQPRYRLAGSQMDAVVPSGSFTAHWWADRRGARIRMRTSIPSILFGFGGEGAPDAVTLTTGPGSKLGRLLDANEITFDTSLRGSFAEATLVVEPAEVGAP